MSGETREMDEQNSATDVICNQLRRLYDTNLRPTELAYNYEKYRGKTLKPNFFTAKPTVLVVGCNKAGKTSYIHQAIGGDFSEVKRSNSRFRIYAHGEYDVSIPGQVFLANEKYPFEGLTTYGKGFMERISMVQKDAPILKDLWFVDTPALDGKMKTDELEALKWFAKTSTRIVLLFDANNLEFPEQLTSRLGLLGAYTNKLNIVLNKVNDCTEIDLLEKHATLGWKLCASLQVNQEEEVRFFSTDLGLDIDDFNHRHRCVKKFINDSTSLTKQLLSLPKEVTKKKIRVIEKRVKKVKCHMQLVVLLKKTISKAFAKKNAMINMKKDFRQHLIENARRVGQKDEYFFYMERFKDDLTAAVLMKYKSNIKKTVETFDDLTSKGFPVLWQGLDAGITEQEASRELGQLGLLKVGKKAKRKAKRSTVPRKQGSRKRSYGGTRTDTRMDVQTIVSDEIRSIDSNTSKRSMVSKVFSFVRRGSKNAGRKAASGSVVGASFFADDGTIVSGGSQSGRKMSKVPISRTKTRGKKGKKKAAPSMVAMDEHLDMFSVVSGSSAGMTNKRY